MPSRESSAPRETKAARVPIATALTSAFGKPAAEEAVDQEAAPAGECGMSQSCISWSVLHRIDFIDIQCRAVLETVRMIARPTAASAAATTITKNEKMWPSTCLSW